MPGSRGTSDDIHRDYSYEGIVIATEKMDGSNIMMNNEKFITRKGETSTADWTYPIRNLHYQIMHLIPDGLWLAGEFLYWRKNTPYENLPGCFIVFGVINDDGMCLGWDDVRAISDQCGLPTVNVLSGPGMFKEVSAESLDKMDGTQEGFVVRPLHAFPVSDYADYVTKWVQPNHVPVETSNGVNGFIS